PVGPSAGAALLDAARTAMERGMLDRAVRDAARAGMHGAPRLDVLLLQGEIFLVRGAAGEAVERFNEALAEISRTDVDDDYRSLRRALRGAARALIELGRMPEAVEAAERLCELAPNDVAALRTLGDALSRVEDH